MKIGNVLSDVFGVSGKSMLLALLDGDLSAERIAQLALGQAKQKITQLTEALEGHCMRDHERFLIRSSLRHLAFFRKKPRRWTLRFCAGCRLRHFGKPFCCCRPYLG